MLALLLLVLLLTHPFTISLPLLPSFAPPLSALTPHPLLLLLPLQKQPNLDCGSIAMNRKAIQNDDADQQMPGSTSRDMGSEGCVLVANCPTVDAHRGFEVMLFNNPPGVVDNSNDYPIRLILSSYYFPIQEQPYGVPDGWSDCSKCQGQWCGSCTNSMAYTPAFNASSVGYDGPVYTHVHRDATIVAAMQQWMQIPAASSSSLRAGAAAAAAAEPVTGPVPNGRGGFQTHSLQALGLAQQLQ